MARRSPWSVGMRGAVAVVALAMAREGGQSAPLWASKWLREDYERSVVDAVIRHRLTGLAMPELREASFSEASLNHLAQRARADRLRNLRLASALIRTQSALISSGVDCLVLKGSALAQQSTGDWGARTSVDIDLLIAPDSVAGAVETLEEIGFVMDPRFCSPPDSPLFSRTCRWLQELSMVSEAGSLDLHWRLDVARSCLAWSFAELWERRAIVAVAGQPVPTLMIEDAAIFNAVHAARDSWSLLSQLVDQVRLDRLANKNLVAELSAVAHSETQLEIARHMIAPLFGAQDSGQGSSLARILAARFWLHLADGSSARNDMTALGQAERIVSNFASYGQWTPAFQRLGVLVWPVREMAEESLGAAGNCFPWLYPLATPYHLPKRLLAKRRSAART